MKAIEVKKAIKELDRALEQEECSIEIYICGGAALTLLGLGNRKTGDIDMIAKVIDPALDRAIKRVAKKLGYPVGWLNNKVNPIIDRLPSNWKTTVTKVFEGRNLTVYSLGRQNLINSKLHACVERRAFDYQDLLILKPDAVELAAGRRYCLKQKNANPIWIEAFTNMLKKELKL
ncbi:DUF6036 family nucleotidyltransferase [Bdellovibrionota bacterium FG-1]